MTEYKQALVIRSDLGMTKGKIAAQCSHASLEAVEKTRAQKPEWYTGWKQSGQAKIVLKIDSEEKIIELFESAKRDIPSALIRDAGHTQVTPGSVTALGIGPAPGDKLDKYTKNLKLL